MHIDTTTPFGARVARRLHDDEIGWLTTIGADHTPQPSPVWFLWDGATFLIYSKPGTPKLRNIARTRRASLHLNSDGHGDDIIVLVGDAWFATDQPAADHVAAYLAKYRDGIARIAMTPESFAYAYSAAILLTPTALRGH